MLQKITKSLLYILSFAIIINTLSYTFDGDLGWHLRFGKEINQGTFPYNDTYTWTFFGHNYTNHEWGGDIVFWLLYNNFGYSALIILCGLAIWLAVVLNIKNFNKNSDLSGPISAILIALSLNFILTVRLAMLSALFFALIIFTLEKINTKTYWYWPIIFWLWAALHGSWILGFITIFIYIFSYFITKIIKLYYPNFPGRKIDWDNLTVAKIITSTTISALILIINPYGTKIWREVLNYFSENYFKQYVTEWLPSYTFPIFPWPLILGAAASFFMVLGFYRKKVTLPQILLFFAIFYATIKHKRNNLYFLILLAPIITAILNLILIKIKPLKEKIKKIFYFSVIILLIPIIFILFQKSDWAHDPFNNEPLLVKYNFPLKATNFLKQENKEKEIKIFNEFWWGGYLNWTIPEAKVFLDGRGTATWRLNKQETLLGAYRRIKFESGGLYELEKENVDYIILNKNFSGYYSPNKFNNILFGEKLVEIFSPEKPHLIAMLDRSQNWELIYQDENALIWKNLTVR